VFAGNFSKIANDHAKKLIEQLGSKVEEEVSAKTNFVVVGPKGQDHPNYVSATTFGIRLMTEEMLLKYVGD
jgi:NAD-dependent DNA ligase